MTLDRLSQITEVGIKSGITLNGINVIGVVTATSLTVNGGAVVNGVVTATSFSGNVTGNITPTGLVVSGVSTFQSSSFWGDGDIAYFGDGQDLLIWHNSTDSIIRDNGTGDLNIEGGNRIKLMNPTGIETYAVFNQDGASELWYDNVKRLETTNAGVTVTGTVGVGTALVVTGNARVTGILTVGTSSITLDGANDRITVGPSFISATSVGLGQTTTTGRNAGVGTAAGTLIYNTTTDQVEIYSTFNIWTAVRGKILVSGGTVNTTSRPGFVVHTFTSDGNFTTDGTLSNVELLVVGGGGGGGGSLYGAGGGAGGVVYTTGLQISAGTHLADIGPGGSAGANEGAPGGQGGDGTLSQFGPGAPSSFYRIATGGGGGGSGYSSPTNGPGRAGGSGGGASSVGGGASGGPANQPSQNPGKPGTNSGNPGGTYGPTPIGSGYAPTGGGGAGAAGVGNLGQIPGGGNGGDGIAYSINGTSTRYGAGGSASIYSTPGPSSAVGRGGNGGGGNGASAQNNTSGSSPNINGVANTGSGGGGAHAPTPFNNSTSTGGAGGSGIIIVAYPSTDNVVTASPG